MNKAMGKVAIIGGGGIRTPLVIFGINEAREQLGVEQVALYDLDHARASMMVSLGRAVVEREGGSLKVMQAESLEAAVDGADFVLNSVRVGGIQARAADERAAIEHGYPGQETTGPGGVAMALRTVPIAVEQARQVHMLAPEAWLINFTNPAGLITQAITTYTDARVVGICDTPTEMLHRIAKALGATQHEVRCEYLGLNHLGWVRRIELRGVDVTDRVLKSNELLAQLYSAPLFDHDFIRSLRLIPTEYLFFYYSRSRALANQISHGATRGTEVEKLNSALFLQLEMLLRTGNNRGALVAYVDYLKTRSGSYMALEASGKIDVSVEQEDPFRAVSGYHRIALDVMKALRGKEPQRVIVNTRNRGAISSIANDDIVEVPCMISRDSVVPEPCGDLPADVRGLVTAVKEYERTIIEAAMTGSQLLARKAMLLYPAIGEWEPSKGLLSDLNLPNFKAATTSR
jgi:6-phospho-beta-glucosidase